MSLFKHKRFDDMDPGPPFFRLNEDDFAIVHSALRRMLLDIADFCDKHDIAYVLVFGSCLGAIRHKGIIPWDDDVDLAMPRDALDRFVELFRDAMSDKYSLVVPGETRGYSRAVYKVRMRGTRLGNFEDDDGDNCGVGIDIFPLETIPGSFLGVLLHGSVSTVLRALAYCRRLYEWRKWHFLLTAGDSDATRSARRWIAMGRLLSFAPVEFWAKWWNSWNSILKGRRTGRVAFVSAVAPYFKNMYRYDDFFPPVTAEFEGREINVPARFDYHLRRCFGNDYMAIPEPDDRGAHLYLVFDVSEVILNEADS